MRTAYAFFRLGWRARVPLVLIWIGGMLVSIPAGELFDNLASPFDVSSLSQLGRGPWIGLWRVVLAVPAAFAIIGTWLTTELRMGLYSWTLPRLREMFTANLVALAVVSSLPAAMLIAHMGQPSAGIAALAVGVFAFAAVCRIVDALARHVPSVIVLGVATVLAVRAGTLGDAAVTHPWLLTILATAAAASCFLLEYLPDTGRLRVAIGQDNPWRLPRLRSRAAAHEERSKGIWQYSLWNASVARWTRAAVYECYPRGWFVSAAWFVLAPLLLFGTIFRVKHPGGEGEGRFIVSQVLFLASIGFLTRPPMLGRALLYPLARRSRAAIAFWSTLLGTITLGIFAFIAICVAAIAHPWIPSFPITDVAVRIASRMLPLLLAWTPVLGWAHVRYARRRGRNPVPMVPFIPAILVFGAALPLMAAGMQLSDSSSSVRGLTGGVLVLLLIVAVQTLYWRVLMRHFDTADLLWTTGEI